MKRKRSVSPIVLVVLAALLTSVVDRVIGIDFSGTPPLLWGLHKLIYMIFGYVICIAAKK